MELPQEALRKSILIVAHPDDEVLWFGSILNQVDKIIICFTDAEHWPDLGKAREKSLKEHACRDRIVLLNLCQVKSHNKSTWPEPEVTDYGLRLNKFPGFDEPYQDQALRLADALEPHIRDADNVFTHNPWGEYGHEDHVQISKVVTNLVARHNRSIWYNSYVSNKSSALMRRYMHGFGKSYYTMPVDIDQAREIADTYYRNDAWTWMEDYVWFASECFVLGPLESQPQPCTGALFPVNYVRVPFDPANQSRKPPGIFRRIRRKLRSSIIPLNSPASNAAAD